jgi:Tol biopolymer transport system component
MLSPDARWIAYVSNESGRAEVYVARFPGLDNKVVVSTDGGTRPRWSRDGGELFYRQGDGMMAVSIDVNRGFSMGKPRRLFGGPYAGEGRDPAFDVTADGSRFLMIKTDPVATLQRLTLVQNWSEELKRAGSVSSK